MVGVFCSEPLAHLQSWLDTGRFAKALQELQSVGRPVERAAAIEWDTLFAQLTLETGNSNLAAAAAHRVLANEKASAYLERSRPSSPVKYVILFRKYRLEPGSLGTGKKSLLRERHRSPALAGPRRVARFFARFAFPTDRYRTLSFYRTLDASLLGLDIRIY